MNLCFIWESTKQLLHVKQPRNLLRQIHYMCTSSWSGEGAKRYQICPKTRDGKGSLQRLQSHSIALKAGSFRGCRVTPQGSSLPQPVLMLGSNQRAPWVRNVFFFFPQKLSYFSGLCRGFFCADISKISLLMFNAFPLPAVSLHVKFPSVPIFMPVEEKKKFNLLKLPLNF